MAFWTSLFFVLSLSQLVSAVDEVVLTSSERKNPDEVDMTFGEAEPVKITEVRREPVEMEAKKEKKDVKPKEKETMKNEEKEPKGEVAPIVEPLTEQKINGDEAKIEEKPLPESVKVEKRRARQHRQKKPPGDGALAGSEDSV